jgi:putative ABC transport system permease protein
VAISRRTPSIRRSSPRAPRPVSCTAASGRRARPGSESSIASAASACQGGRGARVVPVAFPDADVKTVGEFTEAYAADLSTILSLLYVLLALSVVISVFGMVNTMVLAVHERTREIGMLRAVGMTRRQARRMVRGESVITALIGAALGLPLGIAMSALVASSLSEWASR